MVLNNLKFIIRNSKNILILLLIIFGLFFGISYVYGSVSNYFAKLDYINNFQKNYYDSDNYDNSQNEALKLYYQLTDEQISQYSDFEKILDSTKLAQKLIVYRLDFHIKSQIDLENYCIKLDDFEYDDLFTKFTINPKWSKFYGLDIFNDVNYKITYKSNIYLNNNLNFPLQYYEDYSKTFVVKDDSFISGNLVDQRVQFDDSMQIVLMDSNMDKIPDDSDLDLIVEIKSIGDNGKEYYKTLNIPMTLRSGVLKLKQGGISCLI